jgi:acetyl-CoA carboxylase carboxyltransferase component
MDVDGGEERAARADIVVTRAGYPIQVQPRIWPVLRETTPPCRRPSKRLRTELTRSTEGGDAKYVKRHLERGKLLPRDRVEMVLDEGSYFLEIAPLAGYGKENEFSGASVIGGAGPGMRARV